MKMIFKELGGAVVCMIIGTGCVSYLFQLLKYLTSY